MDSNLIDYLNQAYKLDILEQVEKVTGGFLSDNYRLETKSGQKFFLKQHRHTDENVIRQVMIIEKYFSDHKIPIILPISDLHNQSYFKYQENFYSLYPYINAKSVSRKTISDKALEQMGIMLGKIHLAGKNADKSKFSQRSNNLKVTKFYNRYPILLEAITTQTDPTNYDTQALKLLKLKLEMSKSQTWEESELQMPYDHLIHGDYHDQNIFFNENEEVTHIFDLEKSEIAPRLFELIRSIDYVCFNNGYTQEVYNKALIYRNAYHHVYPIPKVELRKTLNAYVSSKTHDTWILHEHYITKSTRQDDLFPYHIAGINYLKDNYQTWINKLLEGI